MKMNATFLKDGDGIPIDLELSSSYFKKLANEGDSQSMFEYASILCKTNSNKKKAAKYLEKAADKGVIDAAKMYAKMLKDGDGIPFRAFSISHHNKYIIIIILSINILIGKYFKNLL